MTCDSRDRRGLMYRFRQFYPILSLSALVAVLLASCAPSTTTQCRRLSTAINKGSQLVNSFDADPEAGEAKADALDTVSEELQAVKLTDETLIGFQSRFINIYDRFSQAFRDTSGLLEQISDLQPNPEGLQKMKAARIKVDKAIDEVEATAEDANALVNEIHNYCTPPAP